MLAEDERVNQCFKSIRIPRIVGAFSVKTLTFGIIDSNFIESLSSLKNRFKKLNEWSAGWMNHDSHSYFDSLNITLPNKKIVGVKWSVRCECEPFIFSNGNHIFVFIKKWELKLNKQVIFMRIKCLLNQIHIIPFDLVASPLWVNRPRP